LALAMAEN